MAIIRTPVPQFNGYRGSVLFINGVGKTDDPRLIQWFKDKGYTVYEDVKEVNMMDSAGTSTSIYERDPKPLEDMTAKELKEFAKSIGKGTYIGNTKDREKLLLKVKELIENE